MLSQSPAMAVSTALAHGHEPKPSSTITSVRPAGGDGRAAMNRAEPSARSMPGNAGDTSSLPIATTR